MFWKKLISLYMCLALMILVGCGDEKKDSNSISKSNKDSIISLPDSVSETTPEPQIKDTTYKIKLTIENLRVKTFEKYIDPKQKDFYDNACAKWTLDSTTIKKLMVDMKSIPSEHWHNKYNVTPCYFEGEGLLLGKPIKFSINGASWMTIEFPDTTLFYGDEDRSNKKYFIDVKQ